MEFKKGPTPTLPTPTFPTPVLQLINRTTDF